MKPRKAVLGLGAACAACCAIPLLGAGGFAALGSALVAFADEFLPATAALLAAALALAGVWSWRRGHGARKAECGCASACSTEVRHVSD